MFVIKKILGHLIMPLPFGLGFVALGLLMLLFRRRARGWLSLVFGVLVLAVASNRAVSLALTASLEKTYPPVPPLAAPARMDDAALPPPEAPADEFPRLAPSVRIEAPDTPGPELPASKAEAGHADEGESSAAAPNQTTTPAPSALPEGLRKVGFVAILGGGHGDDLALSAGQRLSISARARLMEGMRLALALPEAWLVVSGPRDQPEVQTHARVLADAAVELGFPRERIVEIDTGRDTAEEIDALKLLVGDERIALVTSAWHLPRAMKLAAAAGLDAHPCPTDYLGGRDATIPRLAYFTWDADSLMNTTRAWREYVGRAWARLVGIWRD